MDPDACVHAYMHMNHFSTRRNEQRINHHGIIMPREEETQIGRTCWHKREKRKEKREK